MLGWLGCCALFGALIMIYCSCLRGSSPAAEFPRQEMVLQPSSVAVPGVFMLQPGPTISPQPPLQPFVTIPQPQIQAAPPSGWSPMGINRGMQQVAGGIGLSGPSEGVCIIFIIRYFKLSKLIKLDLVHILMIVL